jgi:hypothetical protein
MDPPQDFTWKLCFNDLKSKYMKVVDEEIAAEEIGEKRGKYRQETAFEIAKTQGIIGRDKSEVRSAFLSWYAIVTCRLILHQYILSLHTQMGLPNLPYSLLCTFHVGKFRIGTLDTVYPANRLMSRLPS